MKLIKLIRESNYDSYKDYWAYKDVSKNWESDVKISNDGNKVDVTIWYDKKNKDVYAKFTARSDEYPEDGKFWMVYDVTDGDKHCINNAIEVDEENDNADDIIKHCFYYFNTRY